MGTLTNTLMRLLLGWVQGVIGLLWTLPDGETPSLLHYLSAHWLPLAATLVVFGLVMDRIVWFIRWQPYHLWAARIRRRLGIREPGAASPGQADTKKTQAAKQEEHWLPLEEVLTEEEADALLRRADSMPEESLGAYPGRRYDEAADGETARFSLQRRGETPEQRRQRLEQEEYERKLAEYELKKAQYERDLAAYEREKAEWDARQAELARQAEDTAAPAGDTAGELLDGQPRRRRRGGA